MVSARKNRHLIFAHPFPVDCPPPRRWTYPPRCCTHYWLWRGVLLKIFSCALTLLGFNFFSRALSLPRCALIFFRASHVLLCCFLLILLCPNFFFVFRSYLMWCFPAFHF